MNSKKIVKIFTALIIIATILCAISTVVLASSASGISIPSANDKAISDLSTPAGNIIGVVSYCCYTAAVILLIMLGIKFMTASPEGKAEIKKSAVIYVVGAALVFVAGLILGIVKNTSQNVFSK